MLDLTLSAGPVVSSLWCCVVLRTCSSILRVSFFVFFAEKNIICKIHLVLDANAHRETFMIVNVHSL